MIDPQDYIGKKYNKLTILDLESIKKSYGNVVYAKCRCDCGQNKSIILYSVRTGASKSCGCLQKGSNHFAYKGYGEIYHSRYTTMRTGAKHRNISFEISIEYIWDLFLKQKRRCALSGIEITMGKFYNDTNQTASLDRIDSKVGYIEGNVQWVHKDINYMKQSFTQELFLEYVSKIHDYRLKSQINFLTVSRPQI